MLFSSNISPSKRQFLHSVFIPIFIGIVIFLMFVVEKGLNVDFHTLGIYPRKIGSFGGVFTVVLVHKDWNHLANNVSSFVILCSLLFYFYRQIAPKILFYSYFFSGVILWIIGRDNWHIGASGLIYALVFFLFFSGLIRQYVPLIALSLIVVFYYGGVVWHLFPWEKFDPVSWEGHLAGGLTGLMLSVVFRNEGPQKPVPNWETEENDDKEDDFSIDFENESDDSLSENNETSSDNFK